MKNIKPISFFTITLLLMLTSCKSNNPDAMLTQKTITVLHTNDIHGSYMPFNVFVGNATAQTGDSIDNYVAFPRSGEIGGIARLASGVSKIRKAKGANNVILLDGGDTFSDDLLSNLTKGEVVIKLLNKLNYDMMVLGNHDFDYGVERTKELANLANFPMRAANVIDTISKKPIFNEPYKVIIKDDVRIAILPIAYRNTNLTGNPKNMEGIRFEKGMATIKKYLPEIKSKSDILIVLSHEGMSVDKLIAEKIEGIDLIIGAHSHDIINPPYNANGTFVVQAMSDAAVLAETELFIEDKTLKGINTNYHFMYADEWEEDNMLLEIIREYRLKFKEKLEEYVGMVETPIGRQYKQESPFDKLVTSILKREMNTDVAFMPGVGYGLTLQNRINKEDVYKLIPHNSKLITLSLTGRQLVELLEQTAINLKPNDKMDTVGGLLQSSGITYTLDFSKKENQRIYNVYINGEVVDFKKTYSVATHSGMLNGIHNYTQFSEGRNIMKTDKPLNAYITQKLQEMNKINYPENMGEVTILGNP